MEKAYNDSEGITAKFNKNIFSSLNSKFGSNFNENNFEHNAFFNSEKSRIEMHLVNRVKHSVRIFDKKIDFKVGETIHTENSYKYTYKSFERLSESAGYKIQSFFSDEKSFFGIFILKVKKWMDYSNFNNAGSSKTFQSCNNAIIRYLEEEKKYGGYYSADLFSTKINKFYLNLS